MFILFGVMVIAVETTYKELEFMPLMKTKLPVIS